MERLENSLKTFYKEQNRLLESFLEHTFIRGIKNNIPNFNTVEYFVAPYCNLNCKYCYLRRYGEKLYPSHIANSDSIVRNSKILTDWLAELNFRGKIEIFSGEPTILPYFFDILDYILDHLETEVVIPTNMTFLLNDELTKEIEERLQTGRVHLSASIDGKYLQNLNRPFKSGIELDDSFYEKAFEFASKWRMGFHPMIYSNGIELWQDNFLWFMDMYEKYNMPKDTLYLLEVRNEEWNLRQIYELYKFMRFLVRYAFTELANKNPSCFCEFIFRKRGFNILSSPFSTIGRGLGCSIQSTLTVRLGDLAIVPCHRLSYGPLVAGRFRVSNNKITGIEADNPEAFISIMTTDFKNFPLCESCMLKNICSGGCLGSQFESSGDIFAPIPTVCMMEHWKLLGILTEMRELGVLHHVMSHLSNEKKASIKLLLEVYDDERNRRAKKTTS